MPIVAFYGASDDLIEIEGVKGADEFAVTTAANDKIAGEFILTGGDGQIRIIAIYDGVWSFAIAPVDEDVPIPYWPVAHHLHDNGYSVELTIDVAAPATVVRKYVE